jgi:acyl-coenzyme A synthetase/AMP-(fatty) acid ligase
MVIGGEAMALGYVKADRSIDPFPKEGFRTGDLGYADPDGYVYITGRVKDLIIKGGVNIAPVEITNRILSHPAVKEAVTLGVPDPIYGENVGAFVVAKDGATVRGEEIVAHCRETLPPFKVPAQVHLVAEIPKTERGKVARDALLELLRRSTMGGREAEPAGEATVVDRVGP